MQHGSSAHSPIICLCITAVFVSLRSIIIVDILDLQKLPNAFGLLNMFQGLSTFIGAPMAGNSMRSTGHEPMAGNSLWSTGHEPTAGNSLWSTGHEPTAGNSLWSTGHEPIAGNSLWSTVHESIDSHLMWSTGHEPIDSHVTFCGQLATDQSTATRPIAYRP